MTADSTPIPSTPMSHLDPKVGDALLNEESVMSIMQNHKMVSAIEKLKKDPTAYEQLVREDPELLAMFDTLRGQMEDKEKNKDKIQSDGTMKHTGPKITMDSPAVADMDVPPLADSAKLECEAAKAAGTQAFEAADYSTACIEYERTTRLEPHHAPHWTNLAVALLRSGRAEPAVTAARQATRVNPRFTKGWLRLGEALDALGEHSEAIEVFEAGLKRAEGAVRLALTKGLQRARQNQPPSARGSSAKSIGAIPTPQTVSRAEPKKDTDTLPTSDASDAADSESSVVPKAKPRVKAPPTVEEERALADETARLRRATEEKVKRYADLAKQQTRAAATKEAVVTKGAVATKTKEMAGIEVADGPAEKSVVKVVSESKGTDEAVDGGAAGVEATGGSSRGRRIVVVEEDDDDDSEQESDSAAGTSPSAPSATATAVGSSATGHAPSSPGASSSPGSAAALGAALAQWRDGRTAESTQSAAALAPPPLPPMLPGVSLSNDLIFDLA